MLLRHDRLPCSFLELASYPNVFPPLNIQKLASAIPTSHRYHPHYSAIHFVSAKEQIHCLAKKAASASSGR